LKNSETPKLKGKLMNENDIKYQKMIEDTDMKLKSLIAKWVLRYDYFGFLFSLIRRVAVVGLPNPAAIAPTSQGTLELLYNPILIAATQDEDLREMLHHEGLHVLNKHVSRMLRLLTDYPENQHEQHIKLINIAADCCVNQQGKIKNPLIIAGVPFKLHFPADMGLEPDRMMEEYFYILLERKRLQDEGNEPNNSKNKGNDKSNTESPEDDNNNKENSDSELPSDEKGDGETGNGDKTDGNGGGSNPGGEQPSGGGKKGKSNNHNPNQEVSDNSDLGNHQYWNSDEIIDKHATSRKIDTYTQRMIRKSATNFQRSKARGKMPGYIQDLIEQALKPVPIPYYEIIRQLVRGSKIGKYKRSSTHINRKRTYVFQLAGENIPMISPFPGRKRDLSFKIGVLIDTSGSQSPDDILEALSGCKHLIEKDRHCETIVLEVDTIIHKEYHIKKLSDINFDVKGRGGTILFPGLERIRELGVDVCLCFTDGYTEDFNAIDRRLFPNRMIWVITPKGTDEKLNQVGYTVFLPERNN
jgi:predicted metal-dependent peptidase